jgi:hypothetical protein
MVLLRKTDTRGRPRNARNRQTPQWDNFIEIFRLFQLSGGYVGMRNRLGGVGREAGFAAKMCVCHGIGEKAEQGEGRGRGRFGAMHIRGGADSATDSIDL